MLVLEWKVKQVGTDQLEQTLNDLTQEDYELHTLKWIETANFTTVTQNPPSYVGGRLEYPPASGENTSLMGQWVIVAYRVTNE
jgi:hypothetical protein